MPSFFYPLSTIFVLVSMSKTSARVLALSSDAPSVASIYPSAPSIYPSAPSNSPSSDAPSYVPLLGPDADPNPELCSSPYQEHDVPSCFHLETNAVGNCANCYKVDLSICGIGDESTCREQEYTFSYGPNNPTVVIHTVAGAGCVLANDYLCTVHIPGVGSCNCLMNGFWTVIIPDTCSSQLGGYLPPVTQTAAIGEGDTYFSLAPGMFTCAPPPSPAPTPQATFATSATWAPTKAPIPDTDTPTVPHWLVGGFFESWAVGNPYQGDCYLVGRVMGDTVFTNGCTNTYLEYTYYNGGGYFAAAGQSSYVDTGFDKVDYLQVTVRVQQHSCDDPAITETCSVTVVNLQEGGTTTCNGCSYQDGGKVTMDCSNLPEVFSPGIQTIGYFFDWEPLPYLEQAPQLAYDQAKCQHPYYPQPQPPNDPCDLVSIHAAGSGSSAGTGLSLEIHTDAYSYYTNTDHVVIDIGTDQMVFQKDDAPFGTLPDQWDIPTSQIAERSVLQLRHQTVPGYHCHSERCLYHRGSLSYPTSGADQSRRISRDH